MHSFYDGLREDEFNENSLLLKNGTTGFPFLMLV